MKKLITLNSKCVINDETCGRNLESALARKLPLCEELPARTEPLAIVASGPSVPEYLDEIRKYKHIWAVNGAYGFLIDRGIVASGVVCVDPMPSLASYFAKADPRTTFYLSAMCDPSVFDALAGHAIQVWFPSQDAVPGLKEFTTIAGGTTAASRGTFLAKFLGFREITLYGVDGSFNGSRYCYEHGTYEDDSVAPVKRIFCNGEGPFYTELNLLRQVSELGVMATYPTWGVDFKIRCGGLMAAYLRAPLETDAE